jgi:hypothetical protein
MAAFAKIHGGGSFTVRDNDLRAADLVIGLLFCNRPLSAQWVKSFQRLNYPVRVELAATQDEAYNPRNIAGHRNEIVQSALLAGVKYVFFLDDDVEVQSNTLQVLIQALSAAPNTKVAGGIYYRRREPILPLVWDEKDLAITEWDPNETFECAAVGGGCMLIDTSVFSKIPYPWFTSNARGDDDDIRFCRAVRKAGYRVLANASIKTCHLEPYRGGGYTSK